MAETMAWLERFNRDAGIKSSIIVFGNTDDIYFNKLDNGKYQNLIDILICNLKEKGYEKIVKWDRVSGIDETVSDRIDLSDEYPSDGGEYDLGDENTSSNTSTPSYTEPTEFLPYILQIIKSNGSKTAFILDFSDFIFGNANSLSDAERHYLTILGKTLLDSQSYNILSSNFSDVNNIVILITKNNGMIPPAYYL